MDHSHNACQAPGACDGIVSKATFNTLQRRVDRAEADVRRLTERLREKDRQLAEMGKALLRTVALHHATEEGLEEEIDSLRAIIPVWKACLYTSAGPSEQSDGITIHLPFITEILSGMFDIMHTFWSSYDENNPPKSSVVAHAIDKRLNLKGQPNGEASRSGQTYASAIRPDWLKEADSRHHTRPRS
ncbi:hypothetical protein HDG34_000358 [Paraburkholderia sp. HC6.4b]|uniref:hypothetical protein n=1 Tax=unclassified Paraburkholderia TaxID=2615204 RepID=UPI001609FBBE|nr:MULTISPECIES: hypothetical protein [unclassified Paraburkholderia]MBB5406443.1 hypothetical protein [Paraburkholderia sp. HC6.4b]MBB5448841.1 hypothetical protein [Paraburkholderia sp. Kb1A]